MTIKPELKTALGTGGLNDTDIAFVNDAVIASVAELQGETDTLSAPTAGGKT